MCEDKGIGEAAITVERRNALPTSRVGQATRGAEKGNNMQEKLLAEVMLDNQILKDVSSGNFYARPSIRLWCTPQWRNSR